ncbi:MAG: NUDIX domain-containing protein [Chlamydiae bacterium]|nr:NUDIX domain-containing protein [Chlamydiota bacterium]
MTSYILNQNKTLLVYHPKFCKWLPPGGHLEENEIPPEGAKREVLEETGLFIEFILQENIFIHEHNAVSVPRPYLCLLEEIPSFKDKPAHQHIDLIFIARPIGGEIRKDLMEQGLLRWFSLEDVENLKEDSEIFKETKEVIFHLFATKIDEKSEKALLR